jgi:hypothetical protein
MSDRAEKPTKPSKSGSETRQRQGEVKMRVTGAERADIEARAERAGLTVAGYLRAAVFGKDAEQPRAAKRPPVEAAELGGLRYELRKIGGNLNQIAHHLNQGKENDNRALTVVCAEHAAVLDMIMKALGRESPP